MCVNDFCTTSFQLDKAKYIQKSTINTNLFFTLAFSCMTSQKNLEKQTCAKHIQALSWLQLSILPTSIAKINKYYKSFINIAHFTNWDWQFLTPLPPLLRQHSLWTATYHDIVFNNVFNGTISTKLWTTKHVIWLFDYSPESIH